MDDHQIKIPRKYTSLSDDTNKSGFSMCSDLQTGGLLRTLARTRPGGRFLELGTGTGLSLAFIAEGMDNNAELITIDNDEQYQSIAKKHFSGDKRITFHTGDGGQWILSNPDLKFDFIFADTWPGKYLLLDETLSMLKPGGLYIIDDMLPQPNWPEGHDQKAAQLTAYLLQKKELEVTAMNWSTGIIIAAKRLS